MKDGEAIIKVENVSKDFRLPHEKQTSLKGLFLSSFRGRSYEMQHALHNVSFEVKKGEFFGVVGRNGSGKSTLLKIMAGVYMPTKGKVTVNGSLVPFIELGVGFNPELTGRDNVFLNGALLGFSRKQMQAMYDEIVEFSELDQFMDQKLKNYSSGMQVRLAFSIAIRAQADVLLLDEVLAVGDKLFQQKCFDYFNRLKKEGQTILLVSHSENILRQYCTRGVLIDSGKLVFEGEINEVVNRYVDLISEAEEAQTEKQAQKAQGTKSIKRHGTGKVLVESISVQDETGKKFKLLTDKQESLVVNVAFSAAVEVENPVYGIVVRDAVGRNIISSNSIWHELKTSDLAPGGRQEVYWVLPNIFNTGEYTISPAVADSNGQEIFDWVDDMITFKVRKKSGTSAIVNPPHTMKITDTGKE